MAMITKEITDKIKNSIEKILDDNKAKDIITMDLEGKSDVCNYMIIASGTSDRHVITIAEKIIYHLKHEEENISPISEGLNEGKWALIDAAGIAVHIFHPETREYYDLETLWSSPKSRSSSTKKQ